MPTSPTQLTLQRLRKQGWKPATVEKWNHVTKIRQDLFGFIDVLAVKGRLTLAIQATSGSHHSARRTKIQANDNFPIIAKAWNVEIWSWRKIGHRWHVKIEEVKPLVNEEQTIQLKRA